MTFDLMLVAAMLLAIVVAVVVAVFRLRDKAPPGLVSTLSTPDKITRIKQLRERHPHLSLKQAKDAIEADARLDTPFASSAAPVDGSVQALVNAGHLIEAIKLYRSQTGVGLKEAKEAVERMRDA